MFPVNVPRHVEDRKLAHFHLICAQILSEIHTPQMAVLSDLQGAIFQPEICHRGVSEPANQADHIKMRYWCQTQRNHCLFIFKVLIKEINSIAR